MMPVYNGRRYLRAAVESILTQTLADLRLLIIDDGSDDGSGELLAELARKDHRIELIRRGRKGQIETRNELLCRAQTDIVACADADDVSLPDRLARQYAMMASDPDLIVLGCQMQVIDDAGSAVGEQRKPVGANAVRTALLHGTAVSQPSCMMRRRAILQIGGYRRAYEHAEDYDMLLRACESGKVDNADFIGIRYRRHGESVSHRHCVRQLASADLARATHLLRVAGVKDPTSQIEDALAFEHPLMEELVPAAALYGALDVTQKHPANAPLRTLIAAPVARRQQRLVQRAIVEAVHHRPFDALSARALLRAATLGPGRLARLYLARHRQGRAPTAALPALARSRLQAGGVRNG